MDNHNFDKKDFALLLDMTITMMADTKAAFSMIVLEKYLDDEYEFNKKQDQLEKLSINFRKQIIDKIYETHGELPDEIKDIFK